MPRLFRSGRILIVVPALWFLQAATGSIRAVQNHKGANACRFFFFAMPPNPGVADISATHLDPSDQSAYGEVHAEPVSFDRGSTEGAGTGSRAGALFGDHFLQADLTCAVPAGHEHRLNHQFLTGMKQSRRKMGVSEWLWHRLFFRWPFCLFFCNFVLFRFVLSCSKLIKKHDSLVQVSLG